MTPTDMLTTATSIAQRVACYIFLRWIPSPDVAKVAYTLFALYIPSFIASFLTQVQYLIEDKIDVTVTETEVVDQPPAYASTAAHSHAKKDKSTHVEEEIEIDETVTIEEKPKQVLQTLLTGLPSPTSALLSALTLLINVGLVLAVLDLTYRAKLFHPSHELSFTRLGYISPTEANLLIREPEPSQLPLFVSYRPLDPAGIDEDPAWLAAATINSLDNDTDYTSSIKIRLPGVPNQTYQWVTSNNHTGFFTTPPKIGEVSKRGTFTFLTSSCILPNFPYNPLNHGLSIPGFKHLAQVVKSIPGGAQFMLFVGDFIYVDVPKRFGESADDYRREYRQIYSSPDWPLVSQNLSWIHVLDDHDIANDWDAGTGGVYKAAVEPWHHYHTSVNPPKAHQAGTFGKLRQDATYFEFTQGPAAFFMLDTRTYRDKAAGLPANATGKTMLGADQLADLLSFLRKSEPKGVKWKIVVSSIPFTKNWRVNSIDTWAGYLHERQLLLEAMWDVGMSSGTGIVLLSGDRHEFAATAFPPPAGGRWPISATVNEYSVGPLSQFYLPVHTYRQEDEEDVEVKYIPNGNSKVGVVTIEDAASDQSILKFKLFVDGKEAWSNVLLSPPVALNNRKKDALWG